MIEVREAKVEDIALINSLAAQAFRYTYAEILSPEQLEYMFDKMYAPHNIARQMAQGSHYQIVWYGGVPCGYLSVCKLAPQHYYIEKIYTLSTMYGMGVGQALFEYACRYALVLSGEKQALLELNVNRNNKRAIHFYTKMGMEIARSTDEHVGGGYYANDYVMSITLKR